VQQVVADMAGNKFTLHHPYVNRPASEWTVVTSQAVSDVGAYGTLAREAMTNPFSVSRVLLLRSRLLPADEIRDKRLTLVAQCNGVTENNPVKNQTICLQASSGH
jgi:hypothetical protein